VTDRPMAAVCRALHVARATGYLRSRPRKGGFYRRAEDTEVLYQILSVTKTRASYGYRRTHRLVNREREAGGEAPYNRKRIRRVMRIAGLMLPGKKRHRFDRPHTGKVEMPISNQR
jgi:HTH-like domain